jgi:hypothetical protein
MSQSARLPYLLFLALLALAAGARVQERKDDQPTIETLPPRDDAYRLEVKPSRRFESEYAVRIHVPGGEVEEWCLLGAKPPQLPSQHPIESRMWPPGREIVDLSPEHRPLFRALVPGRGETRHTIEPRLLFHGVLHSRTLVVRQPGEPDPRRPELTPPAREHHLRETQTLDYKAPAFEKWLERNRLRRDKDEGDIHFARRVYLTIKKEFKYGPGSAVASKMVETRQGDCGGLASVFVCALRANGIPARCLCGKWAASAVAGQTDNGAAYYQDHVKTDFFARGVGWVPVDPYSGLQFDKTKQGFDNFGNDHGDHITFNVDYDLIVPTEIAGRQELSLLQNVSFFVHGKGSLKGAKEGGEQWRVQAERLDTSRPGQNEQPQPPPQGNEEQFYRRPPLPQAAAGGVFRVEYKAAAAAAWHFYTSVRDRERARAIAQELRESGFEAMVVHGGPPGPVYQNYYDQSYGGWYHDWDVNHDYYHTGRRYNWWNVNRNLYDTNRYHDWNEERHSYNWNRHDVNRHVTRQETHHHPTPPPHGGSGHPLR